MVPFKSVMSVLYYLPIVNKALFLIVFAERSNVTDGRTDGRTDRIGITTGDLMLRADALASVAKNLKSVQLLGPLPGAETHYLYL